MTLIWKLLTVNIKISLRCNYYITNILEMRPKTQIELTIGKKKYKPSSEMIAKKRLKAVINKDSKSNKKISRRIKWNEITYL